MESVAIHSTRVITPTGVIEATVVIAEGKIKEVAGKLVGNESLEAKGKVQKVLGQAQAKFGDVKADVKDLKKSS